MDMPSEIKLGGIILKIIQVVQDTLNHKPGPKPNTFQSNNNNTPLVSLICNKERTLPKGMSNKPKILMVDINSQHISISNLAFINHSHSWQLWICQIYLVLPMT